MIQFQRFFIPWIRLEGPFLNLPNSLIFHFNLLSNWIMLREELERERERADRRRRLGLTKLKVLDLTDTCMRIYRRELERREKDGLQPNR